jgi:hypothetical protein
MAYTKSRFPEWFKKAGLAINHMEPQKGKKPHKRPFSQVKVDLLRERAIHKIKSKLLPDPRIIRILIMGSSVRGDFGKYEKPGFRGSRYSDFDFIVFVDDGYKIPAWPEEEPGAKPFRDSNLNLAFRQRRFVEGKYDAEIFFIRRKSMEDQDILEEGERAGIPMTSDSRHMHIIVYSGK